MSERCATCGEPHPPCPAAGCICHPTHPLNTPAPLADGWVQSTHWEGCWNYGRKHYDCALAEIAALRARVAKLERVIEWALGERGDFPSLPDDWPKRKFYWRTELRERAFGKSKAKVSG